MKSQLEIITEDISPEVKKYTRLQGDIAERISKVLKEKEIKQTDLAKMLGMKKSKVSKILAGNANLTLKTICRIESALEKDVIKVTDSSQKHHSKKVSA